MWKLIILALLVLNVFMIIGQNYNNEEKLTKESLPEFRKRVEEIIEGTEESISPAFTISEDLNQNIVSFFVQNVKEIFQDGYDSTEYLDSPTETVNELRKKEKGDLAYHVDIFSNEIEKISNKVEETDISMNTDATKIKSLVNAYLDILMNNNHTNPATTTIKTNENNFNLEFMEKQKSESKFNFLRQEDKNISFEDKLYRDQGYFEKSTILFRPVFQIVSSVPDTTQFYYNTRPTRLVISEFMNVSETRCTESPKTTSQKNNISINSELSTEVKIVKLNPLPFLANRKSAGGLMFLSKSKKNMNTVQVRESTEIDLPNKHIKSYLDSDTEFYVTETESRRSCIQCDNVAEEWCSDPKYKLVPSVICSRQSDICYSMHTPFGIVERGCYNVNYNHSTYVCAGNICNYIPFTDLPVFYITKQEWINNVYELSHLKSSRKSTMKKLRCLKCEVNSTTFGDKNYNNNCLEGNILVVKSVQCEDYEMCGIKVFKSQGYIWRGCVSMPHYNYYITVCDSDLCNLDPIASVYDKND